MAKIQFGISTSDITTIDKYVSVSVLPLVISTSETLK